MSMKAMAIGAALTLLSFVAAGLFLRLPFFKSRTAIPHDPLAEDLTEWPGLIGLMLKPRWRRIYNAIILAGVHLLFLAFHVFVVVSVSRDPSGLGFGVFLVTLILASGMFTIWGSAFRNTQALKSGPAQETTR
jgi:hypothetical protein